MKNNDKYEQRVRQRAEELAEAHFVEIACAKRLYRLQLWLSELLKNFVNATGKRHRRTMTLLRILKRWWDRQQRFDSSLSMYLHGRFRVKYKDGRVSQRFDYHTAKTYRDIFGGEIIDSEKFKP